MPQLPGLNMPIFATITSQFGPEDLFRGPVCPEWQRGLAALL